MTPTPKPDTSKMSRTAKAPIKAVEEDLVFKEKEISEQEGEEEELIQKEKSSFAASIKSCLTHSIQAKSPSICPSHQKTPKSKVEEEKEEKSLCRSRDVSQMLVEESIEEIRNRSQVYDSSV